MKPTRRLSYRLRRTMHRIIDPVLSFPNGIRALSALTNELPDKPDRRGDVRVEHYAAKHVPYVAQFATNTLIAEYIYQGMHGRDDPNWVAYGAPDADTYTFWAHRACAIACLKMAIAAYDTARPKKMWQLIQEGIAAGGYRTHNENGELVDSGWLYPGLIELGKQNGLEVSGMAYASVWDVCLWILHGWLVAPAVTPEIGDSLDIRYKLYDGHFVLAYGFHGEGVLPTHLWIHNPSGRKLELQSYVDVPIKRFGRAFAHRFVAFRPLPKKKL